MGERQTDEHADRWIQTDGPTARHTHAQRETAIGAKMEESGKMVEVDGSTDLSRVDGN